MKRFKSINFHLFFISTPWMSAICNRKWYETYGKTQLIFMFCYCINKIQIFGDPNSSRGMKFLTTLITFRKCLTVHEPKFMIHDVPSFVFCSCFIFCWDRNCGNYGNFFGTERVDKHYFLRSLQFLAFFWLLHIFDF